MNKNRLLFDITKLQNYKDQSIDKLHSMQKSVNDTNEENAELRR